MIKAKQQSRFVRVDSIGIGLIIDSRNRQLFCDLEGIIYPGRKCPVIGLDHWFVERSVVSLSRAKKAGYPTMNSVVVECMFNRAIGGGVTNGGLIIAAAILGWPIRWEQGTLNCRLGICKRWFRRFTLKELPDEFYEPILEA